MSEYVEREDNHMNDRIMKRKKKIIMQERIGSIEEQVSETKFMDVVGWLGFA